MQIIINVPLLPTRRGNNYLITQFYYMSAVCILDTYKPFEKKSQRPWTGPRKVNASINKNTRKPSRYLFHSIFITFSSAIIIITTIILPNDYCNYITMTILRNRVGMKYNVTPCTYAYAYAATGRFSKDVSR